MKLTKDEARILAQALKEEKYNMCDHPDKLQRRRIYQALESLENRLRTAGKDQRRTGRTSQDDWTDLLKRFTDNRLNREDPIQEDYPQK